MKQQKNNEISNTKSQYNKELTLCKGKMNSLGQTNQRKENGQINKN